MDLFLYNKDLRHEGVKCFRVSLVQYFFLTFLSYSYIILILITNSFLCSLNKDILGRGIDPCSIMFFV